MENLKKILQEPSVELGYELEQAENLRDAIDLKERILSGIKNDFEDVVYELEEIFEDSKNDCDRLSEADELLQEADDLLEKAQAILSEVNNLRLR